MLQFWKIVGRPEKLLDRHFLNVSVTGVEQEGSGKSPLAVIFEGYPNDIGDHNFRESLKFAARARRSLRVRDRKSTRLNSSHVKISYAVFCLKKKIRATYKR